MFITEEKNVSWESNPAPKHFYPVPRPTYLPCQNFSFPPSEITGCLRKHDWNHLMFGKSSKIVLVVQYNNFKTKVATWEIRLLIYYTHYSDSQAVMQFTNHQDFSLQTCHSSQKMSFLLYNGRCFCNENEDLAKRVRTWDKNVMG